MLSTIIFLLGTFFTSLYPFSFRKISLPPLEQSVGRFGTFALISAVFLAVVYGYKNWWSIFRYPIWLIAVLNAISTITSYISYLKLNIGTAVTTYYLFPIFLFVFGLFTGKETASLKKIMALIIAFIGVMIVHWNDISSVGAGVGAGVSAGWNRDYVVGLVMILLSAFTSAIVLYYYNTRKKFATTTEYLYNVYSVPFLLFTGLLVFKYLRGNSSNTRDETKPTNDSRAFEWTKLIGFNILVGYVGYYFIYRALPRLSIYWVSILSYSGVWMTILLDRLIMGVPLTWLKMAGSGLVIMANLLIDR